MPSKDKRKKILMRLSKLKKIEREDKKKKRTKHKGSKSNNLYQEYVYQKKNRTASYLLVLLIIVLLAAIGFIVYFFIIKPKLDNKTEAKPKCAKNEDEDCQKNEYLDKEKCECIPCENPNPTCKTDEYYDSNNLPYCRNSNEYITDKDGNKKKMYSCQPCPTCPDGKPVNNCPKNDRTFDINNKDSNEACYRPSSDNNIGREKGLSGGAIAGIVISIVLFLGLGFFIFKKYKEMKANNTTDNSDVSRKNNKNKLEIQHLERTVAKLTSNRYKEQANYIERQAKNHENKIRLQLELKRLKQNKNKKTIDNAKRQHKLVMRDIKKLKSFAKRHVNNENEQDKKNLALLENGRKLLQKIKADQKLRKEMIKSERKLKNIRARRKRAQERKDWNNDVLVLDDRDKRRKNNTQKRINKNQYNKHFPPLEY